MTHHDVAALDRVRIPAAGPADPLVFLHEGLGSIGLWRDFPAALCRATGRPGLVYSRAGYGASPPVALPRPDSYMHDEAAGDLPALLALEGIARPILVGHSDGASIALIHASLHPDRVRALVLEAPHVIVEDLSVASIAKAGEAWRTGDLRARLARHHAHVDIAFLGWFDAWMRPSFRAWDLRPLLGRITCPVLVIQGRDDEYGTLAQVEAVRAGVAGPVETVVLDHCGHSPHRDQPQATLDAIARFVAGLGN